MCDPISLTAITLATSVASSAIGFIGQNQAAKANAQSAGYGFAQTYNTEQAREGQIDQQQSENAVQAAIDQQAQEGKVSASASSFGGDRQTAIGATNVVAAQVGRQQAIENINSENQRVQVATDITGAELQKQSQINKVQPESPLALGVSLAGDAASAAADYSKLGGRF